MQNETRLNIYDLLLIVFFSQWLLLRRSIASLSPTTILPLMVAAQIALLVHFTNHLNIFFYLAGNLAVVCAALLPITIPRKSVHWVR